MPTLAHRPRHLPSHPLSPAPPATLPLTSPAPDLRADFSSEEDGGAWLSSVGILVLLISIALGITALSFDVPMLNKVTRVVVKVNCGVPCSSEVTGVAGWTAPTHTIPSPQVLPQQYGSKAIAWPGGGFAHLPIAEYRAEVAMRPNVDAAYLYTWNDKVRRVWGCGGGWGCAWLG